MSLMPDELAERARWFEESKASLRQWAALTAEFYEALKGSGLPDELCIQVVAAWAAWQWGPEEDGED